MTNSLCYRTANSERTEWSCPNTIIQVKGVVNLQNSLSNLPGFIWSKYLKEKHFPGYSYLGPASRLDIRLNENDQPRHGEEPVSPTDQLALHHDIAYRDAEVDQTKGLINAETTFQLKHDADKIMVEQLDQVPTTGIIDKFANLTAKKILQLNLKLGMSINPFVSDSLLLAINMTSQSATLIS